MSDEYVVWSYEHDGWWGPGRMGYTPYLTRAGRYTKAAADEIVANANRYSATVKEVAIPAPEAPKRFPSITCPRCGWVSYNPNDIANHYCGHCHEWDDR